MKLLDLIKNKEAHKTKNRFTAEILNIHRDIKQIERKAIRARERIEGTNMYQIAIATGRKVK